MFRRASLPELLAPAGDMSCLYAAVAAGADAIYVGGKRFGARAFAKNFEMDELCHAVEYCHLHGVKLYVTLNTLIEDREMADAVDYAAELYKIGIDALIIADVGAIAAIRRYVPNLELHASTQMSVHNVLGSDAATEMGVTRVVVARELSLENIKTIVNSAKAEIEVFLHGALCVCHSGQCLFSSMIGGRSGNRGECAQPCRLPYNGGKYPLSLKDLSLANHIPELVESGVASLKIEGRMKSPEYVYLVTSIYRKLLDECRVANSEENETLRRVFSRGGFTDGYFTGKIARPMTGIRSEEDKQQTVSVPEGITLPKKHRVTASVTMKLGEPCEMTITDGRKSVSVTGLAPVPAENSPLTEDGVKARLSKMGNTLLSLATEDIDLTLDEGINLSPSAINALRREAAEKFQSEKREFDKKPYTPIVRKKSRHKALRTAQFFSKEKYCDMVSADSQADYYFDICFLPFEGAENINGTPGSIFLPPVITDGEMDYVKERLDSLNKPDTCYALVGNIGQIELVKSFGYVPIGDFRLNVTNMESAEVYRKMGVEHIILSPELTLPKVRDIGGGVITYGRIPLMITERCFVKENYGCEKCGRAMLVDRKGEKFPIQPEFGHRNLIFNSLPTYMGDRKNELMSYGVLSHHFIFSVESGREILRIINADEESLPINDRTRRVGRR